MVKLLSPDSWQYRQLNETTPGLTALSDALIELVDDGHPVVAGTADLQYSNGLRKFATTHPERFIQFGISEQNMVSAAAGLATTGKMPFVATFASFLGLLCCEQIRMDVAYCKLPVRLIGHHTGISLGFYGTSHHATEDIGTMRSIAGLTVISPADAPQFKAAIKASVDWPEPVYFRIGRGRDPQIYQEGIEFKIGKAIEHRQGHDVTLIACGMAVKSALDAAIALEANGKSIGVLDMPTIKPIDREAVIRAASRSRLLMTVEEHNVIGGLGSAVAEVLADEGLGTRLVRHGIKDEYSLIAPPTHLYRHYELDAEGLAGAVARAHMSQRR
ncbi:transketolase family protein [Burkholderia pseudomultivorans]|uniref:1-deoxy-D-xylulose-5-phosphate synthase n=1 Tax=Burkholderia pseudomultivorans TaxID=1207504 RepID=A0A6P2N3B4_9BURK|nr:transketolase C-terminal domain-containing protein [Burkholderia pseudomultivorans]MDR8730106.1 1-deoxy-D-xylulose-5-phosphate synthase [Burkholderia pseudomultivorans]MDR8734691.1 1-deoxy-D-xylulose-5-phosphate synthase [Burkholderia pseudomultivorans]MDR8740657.1 1-deoxy-D-xylulose-5-phosphate synthase [Burkholderia pseudomultivorans]MDR8751678.1 1-deoxy-D-xylulose-5-phosphate synthase [Burkholderia pseudomultivorans]MDR8777071.1 1-deoxy-D-xylulose-5-phosphate synthase [Burkholderia pseud